jgi:hypothetical protein
MARLQLDLSETSDEIITTMMNMSGIRTKRELVENALMLLGWAVTEVQQGNTIAAVDEKTKVFKEIQIPALYGARHKAEFSKAQPVTQPVQRAKAVVVT